jgi:hypothetical protein
MGLQLYDQTGLQRSGFLRRSAWMRFSLHFPSFTSLLEIAFNGGSGDSQHLDDVTALISLIDGTKNAFSQIC